MQSTYQVPRLFLMAGMVLFYHFLFRRYSQCSLRHFKNLSQHGRHLSLLLNVRFLATLKRAQTFRITNYRILIAGKQNELDLFTCMQVNLRPLCSLKIFTALRFRNKKCFSVLYTKLVLITIYDGNIVRIIPVAVSSVQKIFPESNRLFFFSLLQLLHRIAFSEFNIFVLLQWWK